MPTNRTCSIEGCERPHLARGFCSLHYDRWKRTGDPGSAERLTNPLPAACTVEGCEATPMAKGLCGAHYQRKQLRGTTEPHPKWTPKPCAAPGCDARSVVRGCCHMHDWRMQKHGSYDDPRRTPMERLTEKIDKDSATGCWNYTGFLTQPYGKITGGYGLFWLDGKSVVAHRVSYELHVGPIPEGLEIDHLCFNRACVNPAHLEPVTPKENQRRARQR